MSAGDVLFTHSNLLHASGPNLSATWRRSMIIAYNSIHNSPWPDTVCPVYSPDHNRLQPVPDNMIVATGVQPKHDAHDFLDQALNEATFVKGAA